ncbi:MAG: aldehyde dehydrogenase family protein [Planctomycetota bacterium]
MTDLHGNTIGGERVPARSGGTFEVVAARRRPGEIPRSIGRYARSGAADVEAALLASRQAEDAWWELGSAGRSEILVRAARDLSRDPDPGGRLALRLGVSEGELSSHLQDLPERLGRALEDPAASSLDPRIRERGLLVLAPAWAELVSGPASALFAALALGRTVLVVTDPVAPTIGDSFAVALARAGLPDGVLGVLHDDGLDALRAALGSAVPTFVLASGFPERVRRLERMTPRPGVTRFGAGVSDDPGLAVDLRILGSRSAAVAGDADLARRAAEIAESAFGRARTLSGQLPGQVGRVSIHPRVFSRFTEELLAVLRGSADLERPVPVVDEESQVELRRARVLGHDEGATLIFGGRAPEAPVSGNGNEASPDDQDDAILAPSVFTNVEQRMRLASLARPSSLLCLLRGDGEPKKS